MQNALNAIETSGEITIKSSRSAHFTNVEISDDGVGISREERERIFEPFFTTRDEGTGLAITREIVEAHGGKISFESSPRQGAKFFVELPRASDGEK